MNRFVVEEFAIELSNTKPTLATLLFTWDKAFNTGTDLKPQLEGIKTFLNDVKLSGLILKNVFEASEYYIILHYADNISKFYI